MVTEWQRSIFTCTCYVTSWNYRCTKGKMSITSRNSVTKHIFDQRKISKRVNTLKKLRACKEQVLTYTDKLIISDNSWIHLDYY